MRPIHILLAEDSEGDILLTTEALKEGRIVNILSVVKDGQEAIEFLKKSGKHEKADRPDLILLDVNMPKKVAMKCCILLSMTIALKRFPSLC